MSFMKTLLWTSICSSENRSQKLRVKCPNVVCSVFKKRQIHLCLKEKFYSKMFLWKQRIRFWRNFWKMPLRLRNDPPWSQKIVKILYIFSKQKVFRFVPLAEKVHFWQGCRTVSAIKPKNFRSNPETVEELKKHLTPIVFPRKNPLARRVQFCKPCLRKFSQIEAESIKIQKRKIKFAQFSQKKRENVAWTRKNNSGKCDKVFRQEFKRLFIQSPEMVEQF